MKIFCTFLVIIFFAIYIQAQQADTNVSDKPIENKASEKNNSEKSKDDVNSASKSKLNLSPEKANPVRIAKFSASSLRRNFLILRRGDWFADGFGSFNFSTTSTAGGKRRRSRLRATVEEGGKY